MKLSVMLLTGDQLAKIMPHCPDPAIWAPALDAAMAEFQINLPARIAAFLGQIALESAELTHLSENLNYSDVNRLVRIFRREFDTDHDGDVSPGELEFAKGFVHQPEKMANFIYAGRLGNGPVESGDGWKFRGHFPIQLTGRSNYFAAGRALGLPLTDDPDLHNNAVDGSRISAWVFAVQKLLNPFADRGDIHTIRRAINGPMCLGLADAVAYGKIALDLLEKKNG